MTGVAMTGVPVAEVRSRRMLVAGVGNIFKSDDGFATAVVGWLAEHAVDDWPQWVTLRDFGIRGVHLAYELLDGYDDVVIIDAMDRAGQVPGTLFVVEPDVASSTGAPAGGSSPMIDAHDLTPQGVLALVTQLGGTLGNLTVVGCQPQSTTDGMGLSDAVARQVPAAGRIVGDLVREVAEGFSKDHQGSIVRR
jgi:hydrogenase maturation protease